MKRCIYLNKTEPEVKFESEEHIFPAGIGGIQKLPMEYVSHECNNRFSRMELQFMRNSHLSLPRQFVGPGKRGKLNPKKATQGAIGIVENLKDQNISTLGYLSLGKPYSISQIIINVKDNTCNFVSDKSFGDADKQSSDFIDNLSKYNGVYTLIEDSRFKDDEFIIGYHNGKWYVALSNKDLNTEINNYVQKIVEQKPIRDGAPRYESEQIRMHQKLQFDESSYFRICAKIIFNYLAFVKGQKFVLQKCFDPIRDWIVNGGDNNFANITGKEIESISAIQFPEQAHSLFIVKKGKSLFGFVSFYGNNSGTIVELSDDLEGYFNIEGFICDWKNRQEFKFIDYISSLQEN
ncbi:hypothetical protein AAHH17_14020 [Lysinibacillus capsici]|uniref:hypothetical protein n=1 Tax=Lysinibacillus capsici TaxID=2115968 RepID=UPI0032E3F772